MYSWNTSNREKINNKIYYNNYTRYNIIMATMEPLLQHPPLNNNHIMLYNGHKLWSGMNLAT